MPKIEDVTYIVSLQSIHVRSTKVQGMFSIITVTVHIPSFIIAFSYPFVPSLPRTRENILLASRLDLGQVEAKEISLKDRIAGASDGWPLVGAITSFSPRARDNDNWRPRAPVHPRRCRGARSYNRALSAKFCALFRSG